MKIVVSPAKSLRRDRRAGISPPMGTRGATLTTFGQTPGPAGSAAARRPGAVDCQPAAAGASVALPLI